MAGQVGMLGRVAARGVASVASAALPAAGQVRISSSFDGGNGETVSVATEGDRVTAQLRIRPEPFTEGTDKKQHKQWFYFKASNVAGRMCVFEILDAKDASYPGAWPGTWAVATADRETWTRAPTTYNPDDGVLRISVDATDGATYAGAGAVWVAYFAPFGHDEHQRLIAQCQAARTRTGAPACAVSSIGQSLDGRDMDLVTVGSGPTPVWIVARQHPGESMAEWWMTGFLPRLLDQDDAVARKIREMATFYVVPCACPDGVVRGHLRTNACGANLNREWGATGDYEAPTAERSPEIKCITECMEKTGCDFFLDVHGDEELPHIFLAGEAGVPNWSDRLAELYRLTCEAQLEACPAFQVEHGYGNDKPGEANLAIAAASVSHKFDCTAVTLEMPYKDAFEQREPVEGWSPRRCQLLGATMVDVLHSVVPFLRAPFPFGNGGIGDGLEPPVWVRCGYENPPSEQCWDTSPSQKAELLRC